MPVGDPVGVLLAFPEPRVEVLTRRAVADALEPGEVVDPGRGEIELVERRVEERGNLARALEVAVAEAHHFDGGEAGDGLAHLVLGVREVEEERLGGEPLDGARDLQQGSELAERVEQPARAAVLSVDLTEPVFPGHGEVLRPVVVSVDLDRGHHEIGGGDGFVQVGGGGNGRRVLQLSDDAPGIVLHVGQRLGRDVHEDDVEALLGDRFTQEEVANDRAGELSAPCSDECYFHGWMSPIVLGLVVVPLTSRRAKATAPRTGGLSRIDTVSPGWVRASAPANVL